MFKLKTYIVLTGLLLAVYPPCFAANTVNLDNTSLVGTWKTVSYEIEYQASGQKETPIGQHPSGYLIFTPGGRATLVMTAEGRQVPNSVQDRADLWTTMFAWSGRYRVEGNKLIVKIDVSSVPSMVGNDFVRYIKIEGNRYYSTSDFYIMPHFPEKGQVRQLGTFERE